MKYTILYFLFACILQASPTECFFGVYSTKNRKVPIKFTLNETGISSLEAFSKRYNCDDITNDFIGNFGNAELLEVRFTDKNKQQNIVTILAVVVDNKVKLVNGYYIRYDNSDSNNPTVKCLAPVEFHFLAKKIK